MSMLAESRRRQLLELISRQGYATLDQLTRSVGVSESTVRRDLEALDLAGSVKRTHGGAVYSGEVRSMPAFDDRTGTSADEKRAIGVATAGLIDDGDTVLLDGGTTTLEVARALLGRPVQVVTNSLPIAQLMASSPRSDLILIGGFVYPRTGVALGPLAIATMQACEFVGLPECQLNLAQASTGTHAADAPIADALRNEGLLAEVVLGHQIRSGWWRSAVGRDQRTTVAALRGDRVSTAVSSRWGKPQKEVVLEPL